MKVERELIEGDHWWMALDNLEQMFPTYLERLLRSGKLEAHLNELVAQHLTAVQRLMEESPDLDYEQAQEMVQPTYLLRQNPNWQDESLSPDGQKLLAQFRETMEAKVEKLQDERTTSSGQTT